jgi:hypothetical protein
VAQILGFDQRLVDIVRDVRGIDRAEDVRKLAALDTAGWVEVLARTEESAPAPAERRQGERLQRHAAALARRMETRFPTAAFAARLERDGASAIGHRQRLTRLLTDHPDFDLARTNVELFFKEHGQSIDSGEDPEAFKAELKAVQRVFRLAPTYRQTQALLREGVHSAQGIYALGETQFVRRFGANPTFTRAEARDVYRRAADTHIATVLMAGEMRAHAGASRLPALSDPLPAEELETMARDYPNLKSLFQLTDLCECAHCRSVYSPAAYMVDVLQFLKHRTVKDTTTSPPGLVSAQEVLFEKRPDVGDLDLSCENTDTPLPHIDVVCELLEEAVAPEAGIPYHGAITEGLVPSTLLVLLQAHELPVTERAAIYEADLDGNHILRDEKCVCKILPDGHGDWIVKRLRQTHLSAAELGAAPEYLNEFAYDVLQASPYAFRLPFDLYHQEAQGYLAQFGVRRSDLMRAMQNASGPHDLYIAAEALGFAEAERALITTPDPASQYEYWTTGAAPASATLEVVDAFLSRSELSYADLAGLLELEFVNPGGVMYIQHLDNTCDTGQKRIANLDDDALDRIHRFVRLWKGTRWPMATLDRAIMAPRLGGGQLDSDALIRISELAALHDALGLTVEDVCTFYSQIPDARYRELFVNKAANGFVHDVFLPESVRQNELDEEAAPGTGKKLGGYCDYLSLCLQVALAEVARLVDSLGASAILSFENVAAVYSMNLLADALGLDAEDLLTLQALTGISLFASPEDTLRFVEKAEKVKAAGIPTADLQYLLVHQASDLADWIIKDATITTFLEGLQQGFQEAFDRTRSRYDDALSADENKGAIRDLLALLPGADEAALSKFMSIVDDEWLDTSQTPPAFIDEFLGPFVDTAPIKAKQTAVEAAAGDKEAERKALIQVTLDALSAHFFGQDKTALLTEMVVDAFGLSQTSTATLLLHARLKEPPSAGTPALLDLLTSDALFERVGSPPEPPAISEATFPDQYRAVRLLHKLAELVSELQIEDNLLEWMLLHSHELGWLELDRLPYEAGLPQATFDQWLDLHDALSLMASYPPVVNPDDRDHPHSFRTLMKLLVQPGATINQVLILLSRLTGWPEEMLGDLDAWFALSAPGDLSAYRAPATYLRLERAVALLRKLGIGVTTAGEIVKAELNAADAQALRAALKARYDEAQWLEVLKSIQDRLRHQKRDALVAYLLAVNPEYETCNDLYDKYLIDVEMSACQPTSRIVQAHGTLQLFVQRCLMGLDPAAVADLREDRDWVQWEWMKNYRVWEANRKVFLYPENWIEPELRDDKSPIFVELEEELAQNELSERAVEDATIHYLEKLDELAFLEVCAACYEVATYTMHVFARTKGGDPAVYYYRRFEKERYWTPWQRVDLDITGDHLLAFVRKDRLYLAWPIFSEEPHPDQPIEIPEAPTGGKQPEKTMKRWKVQLAISEFTGKKWLPKKVSKEGLHTPHYVERLPAKECFRFAALNLRSAGFSVACFYVDDTTPIVNGDRPVCDQRSQRYLGAFALIGCRGYPEPVAAGLASPRVSLYPQFKDTAVTNMRHHELGHDLPDDLAINSILQPTTFSTILGMTPVIFNVTHPQQMSLIDQILFILQALRTTTAVATAHFGELFYRVPLATFMPYFYEDGNRAYAIVPEFSRGRKPDDLLARKTFSDLYAFVQDVIALVQRYWHKLRDDPDYDFDQLVEELGADTEYIRLTEEYRFYRTLTPGLRFENLYHPLICYLRSTLYRDGIPALMARDTQMVNYDYHFEPGGALLTDYMGFDFDATYGPAAGVKKPYPLEEINFDRPDSYAGYNWELFFHLPFLMASRLNQDQRFEEAMSWFHYVFDPTGALDGSAPHRYWVTKPFFLHTVKDYVGQRIDSLMHRIAADPTGATITELKYAVAEWRSKPFRPHVIARSRPVAYQKAVLMRYIDNLIDWGDYLFRQDTMESVNEATQLYVLANKLLGPKPRIVPPAVEPPIHTYHQLESRVDFFGNALLDLENLIPDLGLLPHGGAELPPPPITLASLYFCIPWNDKMLEHWDRVEDRLFKIRHCQNIEGVERILALFAPPIDPAALIRAMAAGLEISDVLQALNAPLPFYRFQVMAQKATELVQEVRGLGNALLQALEKQDAERLSLLRSSHELSVLKAVKSIKEQQIAEATEALEGLHRSRDVIQERKDYYSGREYMNFWEHVANTLSFGSMAAETAIALGYIAAGWLKLIPDFVMGAAGFGGTPTATAKTGGSKAGDSAEAAVKTLTAIARSLEKMAALASTQGSYVRRQEEWYYQVRLADRELEQIEKQIAAAEIRKAITERDLENHELQIENAQKTDAFLREKFTNEELYEWMIGQVSTVYYRAYQLAHEVALKAERCFQYELGSDSSFVSFGYWDSLKKGLMAADHLFHDIKRMEVAYQDQNRREYELTKHVSVAMLDPVALLMLKETGRCFVNLPEAIFDLDHPGHYMRRIKSVGLTIPCVTGPYTSVSCTLTQLKSTVRINDDLANGNRYEREETGDDLRFRDQIGAIQSIATSSGQNDSGLFELNFRDERYLPFEGAGAISQWRLEIPKPFEQFDYDTITDLILHIRYTARDGGSKLKNAAVLALPDTVNNMALGGGRTGLVRLFSARHEFPNEWHRFFRLVEDDSGVYRHELAADLSVERFLYHVQSCTVHIDNVRLLIELEDAGDYDDSQPLILYLTPADQGAVSEPLLKDPDLERFPQTIFDTSGAGPGQWLIQALCEDIETLPAALRVAHEIEGTTRYGLNPDAIKDIGILCLYAIHQ